MSWPKIVIVSKFIKTMVYTSDWVAKYTHNNMCTHEKCKSSDYRLISQSMFMLSIAINRAKHVCVTVIIKHNYMLMCNHKIVINIMLCLLNSRPTGHI